jgi:hypothetical protein
MIPLTRTRTAQAIPVGFRGATRITRNRDLIAAHHAGTLKFNSSIWKAAKNQLRKETSGKCAYCEAPTSVVAHGDVEHFRPKSTYWWLAYSLDNFTFSCQICNHSFKGNAFPISGDLLTPGDLSDPARLTPDPLREKDGLPYADFHAACDAEQAHLPDPYRQDPAEHFAWLPDEVTKTVRIIARSPEHNHTLEAAEKVLGLNRAELMGLRWVVYEDLDTFREVLGELPPASAAARKVRQRILAMMEPSGEFAGMVRYFVRHEWALDL